MSDVSAKPYWVQDRQGFAVDHLQVAHEESLFRYGEYAAFVLMWREPDFEAGLVGRCSTCYTSFGPMIETFKQVPDPHCSNCFGSTFEGGFKALLVRPSLWQFTEQENAEGRRGETVTSHASVQASGDFRMRRGDYILRGDGNRFRVSAETTTRIRTGFGLPTTLNNFVGATYEADQEDPTSVVYDIPPTNDVLVPRLTVAYPRMPLDFSDIEIVRGPLT